MPKTSFGGIRQTFEDFSTLVSIIEPYIEAKILRIAFLRNQKFTAQVTV